MNSCHEEMLAIMEACTLYPGSTGEGAIYLVWELLQKRSQGRGLLSWGLNAPRRKIFGKGRSLYLGASKRGRPCSLSQFGLDILQAGLSFAVGLEVQEGPSIFSPDEFAQGCIYTCVSQSLPAGCSPLDQCRSHSGVTGWCLIQFVD